MTFVETVHCALTPDITANIFKQYAKHYLPVLTVTGFSHTIPHFPAPRMKPLVFQEYAICIICLMSNSIMHVLGLGSQRVDFVSGTSNEGTEEENSASDLTNIRCIYCATEYTEY